MGIRTFITEPHAGGGMEIRTMRTFVAIVETGSFVAAAKALGLTRSAAGKALSRLETHLGARLLHRSTRTLSLTIDGQFFYERCVQILADIDEAESSVRQDNPEPKGTLRLTVTSAFGRIVILPLLNEFLKKWPELEIEISFTDRIIDLVEEGFDLAIRMGDLPVDSLMVARRITCCQHFMYVSPGYLQQYGTPENIHEIGSHQRLIYGFQPGSGVWLLADSYRVKFRAYR